MAMTDGERRAYARGYSAGARWPDHKPPHPPVPAIQQLMNAAMNARDAIDNQIATGGLEEDEFGQFVDGIDDALIQITKWLKGHEQPETEG